ncbi:hypothetical protein GJJ30_10750 [Larkinella terrae]|uniref:Terminase n=2 Tax=Larkinella terrae TaxID=2025311 RepID=A0A7K0EJW8_9BACT|nr:hypothetical protein [Larkinella terrae]
MRALSSPADIVIGGASAGVGKTFSLLLEPLRHINNPDFGAVCFRRTSPQIRAEGGLWDTSMGLYPSAGGAPKETTLEWKWRSGAKVSFRHLQYEKDILEWQGSQIPLILWDELTHFTEKMFFYMLSRNRSTCGVKPYIRATCNPDPESWVAKLIEWWIDQETGFPIPERDGVVRYFTKYGDNYIWGDSFAEVTEKAWFFLKTLVTRSGQKPEDFIKSITFISGSIYDNQELLSKDPSYLANLVAQDEQTRLQLLDGNWKVVLSDLDIYDYPAFAGMFNNTYSVNNEGRYLTADIALKGSNKLVLGVWYGFELVDIAIVDSSDGKRVVEEALRLLDIHKIQNHHFTYDADGVGGYIDGFIRGAIPFHNGASPIEVKGTDGKPLKENYANLKTQCFYRSGDRVREGGYKVSEEVANRMYDNKMTVRQRFMHERKAIKRDKTDSDGKLRIIPKEQMKVKLNGESPDLMDMFAQRERFELKPKKQGILI